MNFADFLKRGNVARFLMDLATLLDSRSIDDSGFPEA